MPAFVTHELFGAQVFAFLDEEIQELLERNPAPYFWGQQGPDLLFFKDALLGTSLLPRYGNLMHLKKVDELFACMSRYLNERRHTDEYETLASYILGFAGHYCLDCEAHPYIYFKQMQKERVLPLDERRGLHHRIESDIDTALYRIKRGRNIREYRPAKRLYGSHWEHRVIARLYAQLLEEVYGIRCSVKELEGCFSQTWTLLQLVLDRSGCLVRLTEAGEALLGGKKIFSPHIRRRQVMEDILNLDCDSWYNLSTPEKTDNRSFPKIFYAAAYRAVDMLERIYFCSQDGVPYEPHGLLSFDNGSPASMV